MQLKLRMNATHSAQAIRNTVRIDKSPLLGAVSPLGAWELLAAQKQEGFLKFICLTVLIGAVLCAVI